MLRKPLVLLLVCVTAIFLQGADNTSRQLAVPTEQLDWRVLNVYSDSPKGKLLQAGLDAYKSGNLLDAYKKLKRVTSDSYAKPTDHASALFILADCYAKQGSINEAEELLKHGANLPLDTVRSWRQSMAVGRFYFGRGDYAKAASNFEEARIKGKSDWGIDSVEYGLAALMLGITQGQQKQWSNALVQFEDVEANVHLSKEDNWLAKHNKAVCLEELGWGKTPREIFASLGERPAPDLGRTVGDPDFSTYMPALEKRIKSKWRPPRKDKTKRVVVVFKIDPAGTLQESRIERSSGDEAVDKAAMAALQKAAPFPPLPGNRKDPVDVQFTFDYNVYGGYGFGGGFRQF